MPTANKLLFDSAAKGKYNSYVDNALNRQDMDKNRF
jgi:hypothetical protein